MAGEYGQAIHDHILEIVGIVAAFIMAEALSAFLAATPTGVGQIAAVVIQLGLAAFGAYGMVEAGAQALQHAGRWLNLAWTASGKEDQIAAASKEFLKMLVSIAMAALAYLGVKGNMGNAVKIARAMPPPMVPAFATAGAADKASEGAGAAVGLGPPGPACPMGMSGAMMSKHEPEGGGSSDKDAAAKEAAEKAAAEEAAEKAHEARINELAADPAQGGLIKAKGIREAEVGLALEKAGELPGPIKRDPSGSAEFIDATGQAWDVKAFNSNFKNGYNLRKALENIGEELENGENVILDTKDLKPEHAAELREAINARGWDSRIKWF